MADEDDAESRLPPVPVVNVDAVFSARARMMDARLREYVGTVPEGATLLRLAEDVRTLMGLPVEASQAALDSVRYLGGRELDERQLGELAWRLAGNAARLRAGTPAPPWTRQTEPEWVPTQVVANRYAIKKRAGQKFGQSGRTLRFRFLAGTPCPLEAEQFWSHEKLDVVAAAVGFARKPPYHKAHHAELTSVRFMALVEPSRSAQGPGFFHVAVTPAMKAYNRRLIRARRRIGFQCPEGFEHECSACPRGVKSCPAACHPADYVLKNCPGCKRPDQWFDADPGFVNDYCLHCQPLASAGIPLKVLAPESPSG